MQQAPSEHSQPLPLQIQIQHAAPGASAQDSGDEQADFLLGQNSQFFPIDSK